MSKTKRIISYVCALLMICLIVLQFIPVDNWSYEKKDIDGNTYTETLSIAEYVWAKPNDGATVSQMKSVMIDKTQDFEVNNVVVLPILMFVLSVLGTVFCVLKSTVAPISILPLAAGLCGIVGYLTNPVLSAVGNRWVHFALAAAIVVLALANLIIGFFTRKRAKLITGEGLAVALGLLVAIAVVAAVVLTLVLIVFPFGSGLKVIPAFIGAFVCLVVAVVILILSKQAKKKREKELSAWIGNKN